MSHVETAPARPSTRPVVRVVGGILVVAVVASVLNVVVAAITHAAGASHSFTPLDVGAFVPFTVIGTLLACAGWALVRRTAHAAQTFRWLVPTVLVITFIPDILVGVSHSQAGTSWTGIVGLMVMHVVVAGTCVAVFSRSLPVAD